MYPGETDLTYGVIRLLESMGLVWEVKVVSDAGTGEDRDLQPPQHQEA